MSKSVTAVEASKNSKTGTCSATYAAQVTCPPDCPLMGEGCYAEAGRVGITTRRLNDGAQGAMGAAHEEADAIDTLSGLLDLRLHVVGDCATDEAARIVSGAAERFMERALRTDAWAYTHAWRDVERESWGGVSVLASCHDETQVHEAMDKGYATCMTVEEMPEKAYKQDGVTYIPCIEQTRDTPCVECRLCFKDEVLKRKKLVVLFALHTSKKKATAALRR